MNHKTWPEEGMPVTSGYRLHQQMWMGKPDTSILMGPLSHLDGDGSGSFPALLQQFRTYRKFIEKELLLVSCEQEKRRKILLFLGEEEV